VSGGQARLPAVLIACTLLAAAGCSTTATDPRDPFEGYNRAMQSFNDFADDAVLKPVSRGYKAVTPEPLRNMVRNFFANIEDLPIGLNNMLQGKFLDGWTDWMRFVFNTTFGVFGINDLASEMGLEKHNEDFGQTFGRWGVGDGPYFVMPLLGPKTVRDTAGWAFDFSVDPLSEIRPIAARNTAYTVRFIGWRTDLLGASTMFEEAALDRYVFLRDAYLQRRRSLVYDGNPPRPPRLREPQE
jgi:phospholipid-binding lipoprotein MlaA